MIPSHASTGLVSMLRVGDLLLAVGIAHDKHLIECAGEAIKEQSINSYCFLSCFFSFCNALLMLLKLPIMLVLRTTTAAFASQLGRRKASTSFLDWDAKFTPSHSSSSNSSISSSESLFDLSTSSLSTSRL